ncbi:MAG: hypothetical protein AAF569_04085 [Pseudomonadota bacterium]
MQVDNLLDNEIPEKFKDSETGEIRMDSFVKSYKELERQFSQKPPMPKSADEYCVNCDHGLFSEDKELNQRLFEKGFTQEQVQEVYDLAAEKMVPLVMEMAADFNADREVEKLIEHFGGAEKWKEVSRQLLAFGQKNLPADVLDTLASSYEGVLALYRMMKGEEPGLSVSSGISADKGTEMDLQSMMRDPKYWRDRDPSFVAKVTEGFQKLYGNK